MPLLMHSLQAPIRVWDANAISARPQQVGIKGSPTWVRAIASPQVRVGGPKWDTRKDGVAGAVSNALETLFSDEDFSTKFTKRWRG